VAEQKRIEIKNSQLHVEKKGQMIISTEAVSVSADGKEKEGIGTRLWQWFVRWLQS
jgi:hypothetical protein